MMHAGARPLRQPLEERDSAKVCRVKTGAGQDRQGAAASHEHSSTGDPRPWSHGVSCIILSPLHPCTDISTYALPSKGLVLRELFVVVVVLQMTKLDNDPASSTARPSAVAPAKGAVAPPSAYDPGAPNPFAAFYELPAVKAAMAPVKERPSSSSGAIGSRPAASRSPQALHGPLAGLLLRRTIGPGESLETGQQDVADAGGASLSKLHTDVSGGDTPAENILAAEDVAHLSVADEHQATAVRTDDSMSEAESLREQVLEDMGGCGGMGDKNAVRELSVSSDGQLQNEHLDAEVGPEQHSAGTEVAEPNRDAPVGVLDEVSRVSLSQMDAEVWAELPPEVQQQLLHGMPGVQEQAQAVELRSQVCQLLEKHA